MDKTKLIRSTQNALVKKIILLKGKSRERKKSGLFILEGQRELSLACRAGYTFEHVLFCSDIISEQAVDELLQEIKSPFEVTEVSKAVYQKMAYRESTEGILAIAKIKTHTLDSLRFSKENILALVAEAPEKPGNIGALLRTADAANLDAVLIANPKSDLYNPNIIRSSVGCVFSNTIGMGSTTEIIEFLKNKNIAIYCAALSASKSYTAANFTKATAIVVGTEATGLSDEWLSASSKNIIIPMEGEIDSMNVSVSAAILIFEAKRQRALVN